MCAYLSNFQMNSLLLNVRTINFKFSSELLGHPLSHIRHTSKRITIRKLQLHTVILSYIRKAMSMQSSTLSNRISQLLIYIYIYKSFPSYDLHKIFLNLLVLFYFCHLQLQYTKLLSRSVYDVTHE